MSFFIADKVAKEDVIIHDYLLKSDANRLLFIQLSNKQDNTQSLKKLAHISRQLRETLIQNKHFSQVENGQQSISQTRHSPLYPYRYLISSEAGNLFTVAVLKEHFQALQQRLQMILSVAEQKMIAESPLNVWLSYLRSVHNTPLKSKEGVWFNKENQAVLLIKTKASGFSIQQQKDNIGFIKEQLQALQTLKSSEFFFTLSGAAVITVVNSEQIAFQIQVISTLAFLLLLIFLGSLFRSCKLLLLLSLPLLFAVLVGSTLVNYFYGYIHGISLAFGITIIGVAVDYPLHYFSHLIAGHKQNIIIKIWPKVRLGLVTTLIGFSAITFSSFSGLNQLGVFAMSGLIAAALTTRYLLPLFDIQTTDQQEYQYRYYFAMAKHLSTTLANHRILQFLTLSLMLIASVYISTHKQLWENDLASLSPVSSELKQQDFKLRKSLNLPALRYLLRVSASSEQLLLQKTEAVTPFLEQLKSSGAISFYDSITRYIPSIDTQIKRQKELPTTKELHKTMGMALDDSPFTMLAFKPFMDAISKSKQLKPLIPSDLNASDVKAGNVKTSNVQESLLSSKISSMLNHKDHQWTGLIFLSGVKGELLKEALAANNDKTLQLIDSKQQTNNLIKSYRQEAVRWFLWGCLFIIVFLLAYIKKISALPVLLLPFTGAIIFTLSLLLLLGYSLSIFHLVTLLLVVGLGIDYSVFIYNADPLASNKTIENKQLVSEQRISLFSVMVCTLSSFIMFFALSLSSIPVLKAIGLTASIGASLAFILTLIFSGIRE